MKFYANLPVIVQALSLNTNRKSLLGFFQASHSDDISYDSGEAAWQELADFLEVDRSGLSAEISKLRKENVIECERLEKVKIKETLIKLFVFL